jgi:hypothetical protein
MVSEETKGELQEVIETDFKEKTVRRITVSEDTKPSKFFRDAAKIAKDAGVRSCMAMTVDANSHIDWAFQVSTDADLALMALALESAREDLKRKFFKEDEE